MGDLLEGDEQAVKRMIVNNRLRIDLILFFSIQNYLSLLVNIYLLCLHFLSVNVNVLPLPGVLTTSRLP